VGRQARPKQEPPPCCLQQVSQQPRPRPVQLLLQLQELAPQQEQARRPVPAVMRAQA